MTSKLLFRKITILSLLNSPILNLISKVYLDGYDMMIELRILSRIQQ
jgi:hypothetical protein